MGVNLDIPESIGLSAPLPAPSSSRLVDIDTRRRGKRRIQCFPCTGKSIIVNYLLSIAPRSKWDEEFSRQGFQLPSKVLLSHASLLQYSVQLIRMLSISYRWNRYQNSPVNIRIGFFFVSKRGKKVDRFLRKFLRIYFPVLQLFIAFFNSRKSVCFLIKMSYCKLIAKFLVIQNFVCTKSG